MARWPTPNPPPVEETLQDHPQGGQPRRTAPAQGEKELNELKLKEVERQQQEFEDTEKRK